jgi:hypothetical protein
MGGFGGAAPAVAAAPVAATGKAADAMASGKEVRYEKILIRLVNIR